MLGRLLGESVEHQRLFEQAAAGFEDVLGNAHRWRGARRRRAARALAGVDRLGGTTRGELPVAIALGSNLGDRERHLRAALAALRPSIHHLRVSSFHETAPVGVGGRSPLPQRRRRRGDVADAPAICSTLCSTSRRDSAASDRFLAPRGRSIWI